MTNDEKKTTMEILHDEGKGCFYGDVDGHRCVVEYEMKDEGETMDVFHTFVHSDLRGRGIAENLLNAIVNFATQRGKKIIPSCAYAVTYFRRNPERQGLLVAGVDINNGDV